MGNYMMSRRDSGEAYLAHAMPKTERPGHKWILRLFSNSNKNGVRYFYTPEEVRAYYNTQKGNLGNALGLNQHKTALQKGLNVMTTQSQENTAKWKLDKKPSAETANNYEKAKARNNYARREYYDAQKAYDRTPLGKLSSKLTPKNTGNGDSGDQNGRSRGQSNFYKTDENGKEYRPVVIGDKKSEEKNGSWKDNRPVGRKRNVTGKADPIEKRDAEKDDEWKDNRPVGRKRNVTGKADPIEKKSDDEVTKGGKDSASAYLGFSYSQAESLAAQDKTGALDEDLFKRYCDENNIKNAKALRRADEDTRNEAASMLVNTLEKSATTYVTEGEKRESYDAARNKSYEDVQSSLLNIQNDPDAYPQTKRIADKIASDIATYDQLINMHNEVYDKGLAKNKNTLAMNLDNTGQKIYEMQKQLEKEIEDLQKLDKGWSLDVANYDLNNYMKDSFKSYYSRDEMSLALHRLETCSDIWKDAKYTTDDWNNHSKLSN